MPEEATTPPIKPTPEFSQSGLPEVSIRATAWLRPLIWMPIIAAVFVIILYVVLALQTGAWQLWVTAGFFVVFIVLMLLANRWLKQDRPHAAAYSVILAFAIAGGGLELMIFGFTPMTAISVPLIMILMSSILLPGQWKQPLAGIALYLVYIWAINRVSVLPRYDASNLTIINAFSLVASALLVVIILWLFVRTYATYTLRTKLTIAFLAVSLISMGTVTFYVDRTLRTTFQERAAAQLINAAQSRGTAIGSLLTEEAKQLQTLALSERLRAEAATSTASYPGSEADTLAELLKLDEIWRAADTANNDNDPLVRAKLDNPLAAYLREYRTLYPENVEVFATDLRGALLGATNRTSDFYQADEDWWQAAYNAGAGTIYYSQPTYDESSGALSINIALPIYDPSDSKMAGILRTTVDLAATTKNLAPAQVGEMSLLLPNGSRVTDQGPADLPGEVLVQLPVDAETTAEIEWEGQPNFIAVAPVQASDSKLGISVGQLRWKIIARQSSAEILAPVEAQTTAVLLVFASIAIIITGSSIGLSRILVRPITNLTAAARRVSQGDLTTRATVETKDEIGTLALTFNSMTAQLSDLVGSLEERVSQRTAQLQASAEVGRAAASTLDATQLIRQVVDLITERFGFYYTAIFILNDARTAAVLREASGEAGRILKERAHQLEVRETSMVGYAISQRKARIALDVGADPIRFANPLLPHTRSEIALPLIAGDRVLGALDVQSTQTAAFDEANAEVLQAMTNQIAVALNNAEQFKQTELYARRQNKLNLFSRELFSTTSTEELYRALATTLPDIVPHDYLSLTLTQGATLREYRLHAAGDQVLTEGPVYSAHNTLSGRVYTSRRPALSGNLTPETDLDDIAQLGRLGYQSALSLPLNVGERILGTLNFASQHAEAFSLEGSTWLEQLAGQVGAALEAQRLAQSQQASLRELEALTRQLTGQAWAKRGQRQLAEAVQYARSGLMAELSTSTPELETVIERPAPLARSEPDDANQRSPYHAALAVPIVLRGEVLGGLQVGEAHHARHWTEDDVTFIQAVADQVALALDNARLIEETQQRAERERLVADVSSRMFAANDLESIVQIAGEELGRILQVKQTTVTVRAEPDAVASPAGNGQTPDQHA